LVARPVEGLEEAVGAAAGAAQGLQLGVLGADPGDQDLVDVLVVGVAGGQQLGVVELGLGDDASSDWARS
jgi:hypothetical protein